MKNILQSRAFFVVIGVLLMLSVGYLVFVVMRPFLMVMIWGVVIGITLIPPLDALAKKFEKFVERTPIVNRCKGAGTKNIIAGGLLTIFSLAFFSLFILFLKETYKDLSWLIKNNLEASQIQLILDQLASKLAFALERIPSFILSEDKKLLVMEKMANTRELTDFIKMGLNYLFKKFASGDLATGNIGSFLASFTINTYIFVLFTFGLLFSNPDRFVEKIFGPSSFKEALGLDIPKLWQDFKNIVELQINVVLENSLFQGLCYFLALWASGSVDFIYCLFLGLLGTFLTLLPAVGISLLILPSFALAFAFGNVTLMMLLLAAQVVCLLDEWYLRQIYFRPFSGPLFWPLKNQKASFSPAQSKAYELPAVLYFISQIGAVGIFGLSGFVFGPILFMLIKVLVIDLYAGLE